MNNGFILFGVLVLFIHACSSSGPKPIYQTVSEEDFSEANQVALELAVGFELNLWAPGPLLSNAVSLSFDQKGRAFLSETSRRKSSDIDIREHKDWMTEDIKLSTLEESRNLHLSKLSTDLSKKNTWLEDFNQDGLRDYRDLMVQSERIRIVEDTDGDGRADRSHIFAEEFNGLLTGVAAGVLVYQDDVYLTVAPDLWKINDVDGDDLMDNKESLSHGYGLHIAYAGHDMSGLTIGPDGKLYWSIGDMGVNTTDRSGRNWTFPHEGAVMRCNPDGSDFEVFAHGLRNPQELAFNQFGDLITVDNDGDHPGERERIVHVLEGSDSGWRMYWQFGKYTDPRERYKVWTDELLHLPFFKGQAAYIIPPLSLAPNGPCGLDYNSGLGWGKKWSDHFIASYFTGSSSNSKVEAFQLKPKGSSYQVSSTTKLIGGIVPTGVAFSPDGKLYVNDWKDGYDKKPAGRIWKLNIENPEYQTVQDQVFDLLQSDWEIKDKQQLSDLLSHDDMRVRLEAQFELVERSDAESFELNIEKNQSLLPVLHSIWGLGQLGRKNQYDCASLILPLKEEHPEIRAQAAKVLGENKVNLAIDELILALEDESARVQRHALEALGKLDEVKAIDPIISYVERNSFDPYLRHTAAYALSKISGASDKLNKLVDHPSSIVRMVAVLALRHLKSNHIIQYLHDVDTLVAMEVARAIHDDESISGALSHLANSLNQTSCKNPVFIRRAINANLRIGDKLSAERLQQYALRKDVDPLLQKEAIYSLSYWKNPPLLDRVEGRYRTLSGHQIADAQLAIKNLIISLHNEDEDILLIAAIEASAELQIQEMDSIFTRIYFQHRSTDVRKSILNTLSILNSNQFISVFEHAIAGNNKSLQSEAYLLLSSDRIEDSTKLNIIGPLIGGGNIEEQQLGLAALAGLNNVGEMIIGWLDKAINKTIDGRLLHEVLVAASQNDNQEVQKKLNDYWATIDSSKSLEIFRQCLEGGNEVEGKRLFYQNPSLPCLQCHVIDGAGGEAGPDLSTIGADLNAEELLLSMIEPNARIAPGYGSTIITLNSGETKSGFLRAESADQVTLQDATGEQLVVKQNDIASRQNLPSGMIPAGSLLSKSELRDLVAYLSRLN